MVRTEATSDRLIIRIGPRPNWLILGSSSLVTMILWGVGLQPAMKGLTKALGTNQSIGGYICGMLVCVPLILLSSFGILTMLFGSETVIVDRTDLEVQRRLMGLRRSRQSFPNSTIENLRFEEWATGARGAGMQHAIRFDCVGETVTFASSASTAECYDIIDAMGNIYPFPVEEESPGSDEVSRSPAVTNW